MLVLWLGVLPGAQAQEAVYVTATAVNVRASAAVKAPKVGRAERGARLAVVQRAEGWVEVRLADGTAGWVSAEFVGSEAPALSDEEIRERLVAESIAQYDGPCPCPKSRNRAGRKCGASSAYDRPGGAAPLCYARDVSDEAVARYRARRAE